MVTHESIETEHFVSECVVQLYVGMYVKWIRSWKGQTAQIYMGFLPDT